MLTIDQIQTYVGLKFKNKTQAEFSLSQYMRDTNYKDHRARNDHDQLAFLNEWITYIQDKEI